MRGIEREITLGSVQLIPPGEGRSFVVGNERIAVFHTRSGEVFATQADCPHRNGPLADGLIGDRTVICPLHAWKFDLGTGQSQGGDCTLRTYPVRLTSEGLIALTVAPSEAVPSGLSGLAPSQSRQGMVK